jgi:hypothetical protein
LQIGRSVVGDLIQAFVKMAVEWVAQETTMKIAALIFHTADTASHTAAETEKTTATVANAKIRSIANLGEAGTALAAAAMLGAGSVASIPYIGWALALAAMAGIEGAGQAIIASSAIGGAFADGGRPPMGMVSLVGERGPELFVPDSAGTIIPSEQTAMMLGSGGSSNVNVQPSDVHFAVLHNQDQFRRFMESNMGKRIVVKHVGNSKNELGIPS